MALEAIEGGVNGEVKMPDGWTVVVVGYNCERPGYFDHSHG